MARYDAKADFKVHDFKSLGRSNDTEAIVLLKKIAYQVQPIMRRREWRVPLLSEFFPANPNLLGLNIGGGGGRTREIKDSFLPYEFVLGTMLHELVHNVRGPHDSSFYKLLDEISTECEQLVAEGVGGTGVGFDGPSCGRLGSHCFIPAHNPPPGRIREHALKAAEERAKRQRIMPAGPRRPGGGGSSADGGTAYTHRYTTPAAAAAAAAERRCRDNLWCPCERLAGAVQEAVQAAAAAGTGSQAQNGGGQKASGNNRPTALDSDAPTSAAPRPPAALAGKIPSRLVVEEVEAEIVRQIEAGIVDLTLDSDSEAEPDPDPQPPQTYGGGPGTVLPKAAQGEGPRPADMPYETTKGRLGPGRGGAGGGVVRGEQQSSSVPPSVARPATAAGTAAVGGGDALWRTARYGSDGSIAVAVDDVIDLTDE